MEAGKSDNEYPYAHRTVCTECIQSIAARNSLSSNLKSRNYVFSDEKWIKLSLVWPKSKTLFVSVFIIFSITAFFHAHYLLFSYLMRLLYKIVSFFIFNCINFHFFSKRTASETSDTAYITAVSTMFSSIFVAQCVKYCQFEPLSIVSTGFGLYINHRKDPLKQLWSAMLYFWQISDLKLWQSIKYYVGFYKGWVAEIQEKAIVEHHKVTRIGSKHW